MNLYTVSITLLFLCFLITFTAASGNNPTHFTGDVSINCGSSGSSSALSGMEWLGDVQPKLSSLQQIKGSSTTSTAIHKLDTADPVPHKTARVSRSPFSYEFQVEPGQKIIRFHFHSTPYKGFKGFKDLFTIEAGSFTLLGNFSASLTADALGVNYFAKEFCLNIQENQRLIITFSPESSQSLDTYAFINGIEIISVPASLSYFHDGDIGVQVVGQQSLVFVDYNTALEIVHRLNIKQISVLSTGDFDGIFPKWAMQKANKIKNITWKIPVDVGFRYLIRLHFSEQGVKIAGTSDMMFKVLINEMMAHTNIDIAKERNKNYIPWYRDYMVMMRGHKKEGKCDLLISLESYDELIDGRGFLSGFEIFKLSNHDNSLASPNPLPTAQDSPSGTMQTLLLVLGHRNGLATVAINIIALVCIIVHNLREIWEASSIKEENKPSARAERLCRCFSLVDIQLATRNFSDALLIGKGGFGKVYKGLIDKGQKTVAVKRLKSYSKQGSHEFLTEVETLSELRHVNLVSLIGYCNENGEMILVYDYMACGTLADQLYKLERDGKNCSSLTWKQRLNICIGASRGLDYLHTGHGVIHRDVKASNILLDENFVAKVSDFGLAKAEHKSKLQSYVSTKVKGTPGYLDPYYMSTCKLTRKSDTYAFGVVLLEVLCGRPAVASWVAENERILTKWAQDNIGKGEVDQIVDSSLREEISADSLKTFIEVAQRCLCDEPKNRPTMSQIVMQLEIVLEQQESKQVLTLNEIASVSDGIHPCDDEIDHIDNPGKPTMASPDVQHLIPPRKEQTNSKVVDTEFPSGRKDGRKATMHKPSRLWPWDGFLNRVKPSKKNELLLSEMCEEICEADIKLAKFDWRRIAAATNQFSSSNKVGEGGFGPVYKGVLPTGQVVAIKRLSPASSTQGLQEFKNEILLLPNLQHRNIIKLLGYCIHAEEVLLLYEFMENRGLDTFIFGAQRQHLQWQVRFEIIMGIARGLVYLHQDLGLRVIHRNLRSSSILLDTEMNPKIADFGIARTLAKHQSELETMGLVGTFGYMAPENLMQGKFSVKSDVYSFGIIVMEIVSGRKIQRSDSWSMFLLDYAWKLWNEGKALDMVDESLGGAFPVEEALRCINVSLLCIQEQPHHRPAMLSVIKMLVGKELLVKPQEPWPRARKEDSVCSSIDTNRLYIDANTKLTKFGWNTIVAATNQFSSSNKVGQGGFGSVYKAVLPTAELVAVKRLSPTSRQGLLEFKNEIDLLPNLQHLNIIKLLGYCIHGEEKLLVYEFMENTSLNTYIDEEHRQRLEWPVRFKIIMGIARGVVYLHQDSELIVIYRDLKSSNILLDSRMNPKISDFALARTLAEHQSEPETSMICGTYGYMAPEYCMDGKLSVKTDVYSFGIVVLEIVSGRRIVASNQEPMFLVDYAWKLWNEGRALDLVDASLGGACPVEEALRCIQVGLLCIQEQPDDRPPMPLVIKMLEGDELPTEPQKPWLRPPNEDPESECNSDATFEFDDILER